MFDLKMDERIFWRSMNPRRLHALFSAYFRRQTGTTQAAAAKQSDTQTRSLAAYLMGG